MSDNARIQRLFSGVLALRRDANVLRPVEPVLDGSGRRRVRPSVAPVLALLQALRSEYLELVHKLDPSFDIPKDPDEPIAVADWRARLNDPGWTPAVRQHILALGIALAEMDRLQGELAELQERVTSRHAHDDYDAHEVLDLIEALVTVFAPIALRPDLVSVGVQKSVRSAKSGQRRKEPKFNSQQERRWMLDALATGRVTSKRIYDVAGKIVLRERLADPTDKRAFRRARQRLINFASHLL